jgi:serine protease Do
LECNFLSDKITVEGFKMRKITKFFLIGTGLFLGVVIGLAITVKFDFSPRSSAVDGPAEFSRTDFEGAVEKVANVVGKTVVSISTERTERTRGRGIRRYYFGLPQESPFDDDFIRRFFEDFFGELPEREFKQQGLGSGVIIDKEGYILTNEHVVSGADKITVTLPDGREFEADVKGMDRRSDLAVIKISGYNFPAAVLGDSDNLKIGQWVVAIGNPFGFALQNPEPTVTVGVISALHRSLGRVAVDRHYGDLIQTDAAINPGNSGGPLVNLRGEVVGINVAIFSTTGGYQGVGFAVPSNLAKRIVSRLIEGKKIEYGWLGVTVQNLDEKLAGYFGIAEKKGVLVSHVLSEAPAKKAGIKEGDVIVKFANKETNKVNDLLKAVGSAEVGKKVKIEVVRDKKALVLEVEVGARPETVERLKGQVPSDESARYWRGLFVKEITPELSSRYRLNVSEGVVVADVEPNSPADEAGLSEGDVILEINRTYIDDISAYKKATKEASGDALVRTIRGFFVIKGEPPKQ